LLVFFETQCSRSLVNSAIDEFWASQMPAAVEVIVLPWSSTGFSFIESVSVCHVYQQSFVSSQRCHVFMCKWHDISWILAWLFGQECL